MSKEAMKLEPCGWQFFQDGKWHNGMDVNNHRRHTEAAGVPVRDVYPSPQQEPVQAVPSEWRSALQKLAFMSRTSGGTAGHDAGLVEAVEAAERLLSAPYLYKPPPAQRTWVGLTHDEYDAICDKHSAMSDFDFLGDIEAKLKEKNT